MATVDPILKIVTRIVREKSLTAYRLHGMVRLRGHEISQQTIYNFLDGKPVKSDTIVALMDTLGLEIVEKEARK